MDPYLETKIKSGPLEELEAALRSTWDAEKLNALWNEIKRDRDLRLAQISARLDRIRGS